MKEINGQHLIQLFEEFSPKKFALEGDKVGLQVGTLNKPIRKVMIALDVLDNVVNEAITEQVDLIIAHHPLIYRPIDVLDTETAYGKIIQKLIKNNITVYSAHTNLDVANGGVNDMLANALQLENCEVLAPTFEDSLKKLVVFVPESDEEAVRNALGDAGAGAIGNYSHCSFISKGTGSFRPGAGSNPHIGEQGKQEFVNEVKIECIVPESTEKKVVQALIKAHPYEEVAYDLYRLDNEGNRLGLGRIGELDTEMTLHQFAEHVKQSLDVDHIRVTGDLHDKIKKVAVLGGDGNKYVTTAKRRGADVFVTGDVYYHVAHDAMMLGLNVVDAGHNVEKIMKHGVKRVLKNRLVDKGYNLDIIASKENTDPFQFL